MMKFDNSFLFKLADRVAKDMQTRQILNCSLMAGDMGRLIYLYEISRLDSKYEEIADLLIDRVLAAMRLPSIQTTYCNGLAGGALGLLYLEDEGFIEGVEDSLEEIDLRLTFEMRRMLENNNIDFLHGATGLAFYFIERLERGNLRSINPLKLYVDYLLNNAITGNDSNSRQTVKWDFHDDKPERQYPICLSHGISSIAMLLCRLLPFFEKDEKYRQLIEGIANYLIDQKIDPKAYGSVFPSFSTECTPRVFGSRLAWCYGDIGIVLALEAIAKVTSRADCLKLAKETALYNAVNRRNPLKSSVYDGCICHGSAGVAQFFKAFSERHSDIAFKEAYDYWRDMTLCNFRNGDGHFGFPGYDTEKRIWIERDSILEGSVGVALMLNGNNHLLNKILLLYDLKN